MQPQGFDMSIIREAMARRQSGGLGGGNPLPLAAQQTTSPQMPTPNMSQLPVQVRQSGGLPGNEQMRAGQQAQGPQFDPETRNLAKSLVQRLLKGL